MGFGRNGGGAVSYAYLSTNLAEHRKLRRLTDAAFRVYVSGLCWAAKYRTGGHIPSEDLPFVYEDLDDAMDPDAAQDAINELLSEGLWHNADRVCGRCEAPSTGYLIHDFVTPSDEGGR